MAHSFIVGADLFGFADDNWELVKRRNARQISNEIAKGGDGEYMLGTEQSYDKKNDVTLVYRAKSKANALAVAISLGLLNADSSYIPISIKVNTKIPGHAEVEITGHKHDGDATHEVNSIAVTCNVDGWGATDFCCLTVNEGCQSGSWSATIEHSDKLSRKGDFFVGRSQGCKIEVSGSYISDTAPALAADLTDDGSEISEGDDFWTASLKAHKYLIPA
jgi:hypothetical protein